MDLVGLQTQSHGPGDAVQDGDVVEFADHAFDSDPMRDLSGSKVDDQYSATRLDVSLFEFVVECEPAEGFFVARLRQTDNCVIADERKTAQISGTEG